ncbi:MAG TPA: XdhC/CoxI family protein [Cyclobacteriaceae bacterium]|nr:XdhC/CoxI family protein [Cyclobacteriaceae bacterium]
MKEQKNIIEAFLKIRDSELSAALATVVRVKGSSYRSPGARMLITDDGRWVGSISGGCLEGDALRKARNVMASKRPLTVTYDTREESNQNLGIGLGCNGVIDVLIEPVNPQQENNPITLFQTITNSSEPIALATVFESSEGEAIGKKFLIDGVGKTLFNSIDQQELVELILPDLKKIFDSKRSETRLYQSKDTKINVFIELIQPVISLIIFGGGFDARPVSQLAKSLGWNVSITDECVSHIAPIFFPSADKLQLCQREFVDRDFNITPYTACVLMSHNYDYDRDVLKKLLQSPTPYIGILGPRKRFEKMQEEFLAQGIILSEKDFHRIHSPIGLDIGAEAPDEIAVSIVAEIQSKFSDRSGGFLKYNPGPIHQRDLKTNEVFKQVYLGNHKQQKIINK